MECLPLLLAGMAMSTCGSGESVSQNAMVGMLTYADSRMGWWSVRGSVRISSRGSSNAFWIWLVKVPVCVRTAADQHHRSLPQQMVRMDGSLRSYCGTLVPT